MRRTQKTARCLALVLAWAALSAGVRGQDPQISFVRDVQPILAESCLVCHGADPSTREVDMRFDSREGMLADRGGYAPVVPGKPEDSEILKRVAPEYPEDRMPPPGYGEALDEQQVEVLRRWIAEGARWQAHWAYEPMGQATVPGVSGTGWADNPIDRFVLARLQAEGLQPSAEAPEKTLLRRLALDLTGLPPTPAEMRGFLDGDRGYEDLVDHYLGSPAFGVHWARQWLDIARYADSHGFNIDGPRSIWPWRDWVVDAIAADMPFDQFTIEQLAGDLLPDSSRRQKVATGFHRNTQVNQEGGAKDEENRVNVVIDRVNTTGAVWLGTTLGCAQCHTHKFDPISHEEYYQLFAFFNQTTDGGVSAEPTMLVPRNAEQEERARIWETELTRLQAAYRTAREDATRGWQTWQPSRAWGSNGPELRPEEDGSFKVVGHNAVYSTYVLQGRGAERGLRALRLEALPDRRLRDGGPGRAANGNFVLQHVRLYARPWEPGTPDEDPESPWQRLPFASAQADFEQDTSAEGGDAYPVTSAAGAEPGNGWAIKPAYGTPHAAEFVLERALADGDWELRLELQQEHSGSHTLGAFRVALTGEEMDPVLVPKAWSSAWEALQAHQQSQPRMTTSLVLEARTIERPTHLFNRGSFLEPRQQVQPGFPKGLNHFDADSKPTDRLDLARWLVHPENALTLRVTVNRWWQQLFGRGIVPTENDFGIRGDPPSHPALLEWLAAELRNRNFSRKSLLRLIVTSATYRQDSTLSAEQLARDPDNRLLARQRRRRLSGEVLRDVALSVSGLIDPRLGGPPVQPPQPEGVFSFTQRERVWDPSEGSNRFRRSLYTRIWRQSPYPFYAVFDTPGASVTCTRRSVSNTPLQALAMANDPMLMEIARGFAERILKDRPQGGDARRLSHAVELALGRRPSAAETDLLLRHLDRVRQANGEMAGWTAVARLLFNLDEFLTGS